MTPAKILYVHQDGAITGSAISLRNLIFGLRREEYEPYVLLAGDGPARALYEEMGVSVDVVNINGFWTFPGPKYSERNFFRNYLAFLPNQPLRDYLLHLNPSIVHVNDKSMLTAGLVAKRIGLPVVWHLRSTYAVTNARVNAWVSKRVIKHCSDYLISISEDELDGFEGSGNLQVIFNSVDLNTAQTALQSRDVVRRELGFQESDLVVGLVGSLNERKGAWDFINAAGTVRKDCPQIRFRFVIMAGIPKRDEKAPILGGLIRLSETVHPVDKAWSLAQKAEIQDVLTITGFRTDPLNVIAAMDIVVVANRLGVLGRPPFEAMSVERPLVVTAGHSGRSTVVVPNETALVVPPRNNRALAEAIKQLSISSELRQKFSSNGHSYARQYFDLKKNALLVQDIYAALMSRNSMQNQLG